MSEDLNQKVEQEVSRVSALPLEEQPAAFAAIRDQLERALESDSLESETTANQGA